MHQKFVINGGARLAGNVLIGGSKNTVLPLIAASLLTEEPVMLTNVPDIQDVTVMLSIAEKLGATVERDRSQKTVRITAKTLEHATPDSGLARQLRGSILFAGSLLGRLRSAAIPHPGGDAIGSRPLTPHLSAFTDLGVRVTEANKIISLDGSRLRGNDITLEEPSVTATENAILAAVCAPGKTLIRLVAAEPHVQELVKLLQSMGAVIRWRNMMRLEIEGVPRLSGATHAINPDEQEISSFAVLAAATHSRLLLTGVEPDYLDAVFLQLRKMGVPYTYAKNTLTIEPNAKPFRCFRIQSGLYPKLGSDHLPPFAVLATQAEGTSLVHEWLYEGRLKYIPELQKMGAECSIEDPHRAFIRGPRPLHGAHIESYDIRTGMTLLIASLVAEGESIIEHIEHIDRGYETIEKRLSAIGASIERTSA